MREYGRRLSSVLGLVAVVVFFMPGIALAHPDAPPPPASPVYYDDGCIPANYNNNPATPGPCMDLIDPLVYVTGPNHPTEPHRLSWDSRWDECPANLTPTAQIHWTFRVLEADGVTQNRPWTSLNMTGWPQCPPDNPAVHGTRRLHVDWTLPTGAYVVEVRAQNNNTGENVARGRSSAAGTGPAVPTNLQIISINEPGQTLSFDQVAALALRTGWTGNDAVNAVAVARAESSFRTKAVSYIGCCFGLWQIYASVHNTTMDAMFNPYQNAAKAFEIWSADPDWSQWEAFTGPDGSGSDGPYQQYLADAQAAVNRQEANHQAAYGTIDSAPQTAGGRSVTLGWDDMNPNPAAFKLERSSLSSTSGFAVVAGSIAGSAIQYTDKGVDDGRTYWYRLRSVDAGVDSAPSNVVQAVVPNTAACVGFQSLRGSLINGKLSVYFKWEGANQYGWDVKVPSTGAVVASIEANQVAGFSGVYGGEFDITATGTDFALVHRGDGTCTVTAPLSTTTKAEPSQVAGEQDDTVTDEDGASCGLNLFCLIKAALRWAFVPGETTKTAWQQLKLNVFTKPPFSIVIGGINTFTSMWSVMQQPSDGAYARDPEWGCLGTMFLDTNNDGNDDGTCLSQLVARLGQATDAPEIRGYAGAGIYIGMVLIVWRMAEAAIGKPATGTDDSGDES